MYIYCGYDLRSTFRKQFWVDQVAAMTVPHIHVVRFQIVQKRSQVYRTQHTGCFSYYIYRVYFVALIFSGYCGFSFISNNNQQTLDSRLAYAKKILLHFFCAGFFRFLRFLGTGHYLYLMYFTSERKTHFF